MKRALDPVDVISFSCVPVEVFDVVPSGRDVNDCSLGLRARPSSSAGDVPVLPATQHPIRAVGVTASNAVHHDRSDWQIDTLSQRARGDQHGQSAGAEVVFDGVSHCIG